MNNLKRYVRWSVNFWLQWKKIVVNIRSPVPKFKRCFCLQGLTSPLKFMDITNFVLCWCFVGVWYSFLNKLLEFEVQVPTFKECPIQDWNNLTEKVTVQNPASYILQFSDFRSRCITCLPAFNMQQEHAFLLSQSRWHL